MHALIQKQRNRSPEFIRKPKQKKKRNKKQPHSKTKTTNTGSTGVQIDPLNITFVLHGAHGTCETGAICHITIASVSTLYIYYILTSGKEVEISM